ncbi:MAG: hypothetical protein KIT09_12075 [Bryobacteraceae bacterium]|nr:hypothetical protein [Bryobacteraceae bacterium]
MLPVLSAQLRETAEQVEEAVVSVCGGFHGMAAQARDTVKRASRLLAGEANGDGAVEQMLETFRQTLTRQLERLDRGSELFLKAIQHLEDVDAAMGRVVKVLAEVDRIAFSNKLMALNAKIQAVHVGELGSGFGVVADEISLQALRSSELTEQVSDIARQLGETVKVTAADFRAIIAADEERAAASRKELETALDGLGRSHEEMRRSLAEVTDCSEQLAEDITKAVVALQFQDRVKQRIGHVVETLEALGTAYEGHGSPHMTAELAERRRRVADDMRSSYTMAAERSVLERETSGVAAGADDGGDVELF